MKDANTRLYGLVPSSQPSCMNCDFLFSLFPRFVGFGSELSESDTVVSDKLETSQKHQREVYSNALHRRLALSQLLFRQ
jgi:hypothetical protein